MRRQDQHVCRLTNSPYRLLQICIYFHPEFDGGVRSYNQTDSVSLQVLSSQAVKLKPLHWEGGTRLIAARADPVVRWSVANINIRIVKSSLAETAWGLFESIHPVSFLVKRIEVFRQDKWTPQSSKAVLLGLLYEARDCAGKFVLKQLYLVIV